MNIPLDLDATGLNLTVFLSAPTPRVEQVSSRISVGSKNALLFSSNKYCTISSFCALQKLYTE